uniref:Uncharacterized protein n=1 Tax=Hanusia phi TaxID=3032 RepID=A0A7S0EMG8_9CRYP
MQAGGAGESMSKEYTLRRQKTADILEQYKRVAEDAKRNMGTALAFLDSQAEEPLEQANVREVGMGAMDLSSYQMLKENFEQQLLNVRESYEEALNAVREQLNEMCEQYERLQLQSSMQIRQITERRDKLVDQLRTESELRLKSESYMNQALVVVARLTGRNLHDISPETILFGEQLDRGQAVLQHGRYVIEMKSKLRSKLASLMEVDLRVRSKLTLQTCLHAWTRLAYRRRILFRCFHKTRTKHVGLQKFGALKGWQICAVYARAQASKTAKAISHRPKKYMRKVLLQWRMVPSHNRKLLSKFRYIFSSFFKHFNDAFFHEWKQVAKRRRYMKLVVLTSDNERFHQLFRRWSGGSRLAKFRWRKGAKLQIRAEKKMLKAIIEQWFHCRYKYGSVRALALRSLRSAKFKAFDCWAVGYARHLESLKRSLRCVRKIVSWRRGRYLRRWKKIVKETKLESLVDEINLNHKVVEDLRRDLKDAKESNEVLTNRVAILERHLSQSHAENQLVNGRLKKLETAFEEQEKATLAAASIVEEAMMQVSSETGAGAAKLMALYKRVQELEAQLQGASLMNKRLEALLRQFGSASALQALDKISSTVSRTYGERSERSRCFL